jgi:hypothetical protein
VLQQPFGEQHHEDAFAASLGVPDNAALALPDALLRGLHAHELMQPWCFISREVEIETVAIPSTVTKTASKDFIARTIDKAAITTTWVFGFDSGGPGPLRYGGFDHGTWQSQTEREFYEAIRQQLLTNSGVKKSQLSGNEGDAAVAATSFFSIVLTCESPQKAGPLRFATAHGGKVLYLADFGTSGLSLQGYIERFYQQI